MESRLEARPSHTCAERPDDSDDHQLVGSNGDFPMGFTGLVPDSDLPECNVAWLELRMLVMFLKSLKFNHIP